jgi:hypothetical protein
MSYVHDDQHGSLLGRGVRDRAVLVGRRCGVSKMSMLGERLMKVKSERDELVSLLRFCVENLECALVHHDKNEYHGPSKDCPVMARLNSVLSRYDLPEDYDEG